jgi:hypothetical protein
LNEDWEHDGNPIEGGPYDLPVREVAALRPPPVPRRPSWRFQLRLSTVKDLAWFVAALIAGYTWFQNRASKTDVDDAERRAVEKCTAAISSAMAPVANVIGGTGRNAAAPEDLDAIRLQGGLVPRQLKDEGRWNKLDGWIAQVKVFHRPNETPAPTFGSKAEQEGRQ